MSRAERRRFILRGLLRALILTVVLFTLYFLAPLAWIEGVPVGVVLVVAPLVLLAVSWWQIRAILRSPQPGLRGIEALAVIAPLYLLLFAATYFLMARADPASFSIDALTRLDTLYFTVTVFSTVGFGDISPTSEAARLLAMIQMILNLIVLGAGVRLLTAAVRRGREAKAQMWIRMRRRMRTRILRPTPDARPRLHSSTPSSPVIQGGSVMTNSDHTAPAYPESVESRIGTLHYDAGCPTPDTSRRLFDEMDFQRAVQAYLWAYPAVSFESIRSVAKDDLGMDFLDLGIADNFVDPKSLWLTANDTTIYAFVNFDLSQGPVVIEIPPGAIVGLVDDFWEKSLVDVGLPGPDAGNGGKFLVLPPGHEGEDEHDGYYTVHAHMHDHNMLVRGIIVDGDVPDAVQRIRNVKVYPWSEREDPTPNRFVSISGALIDTRPPGGMEFWTRLSRVIDNNPVQEHDRF